MRGNWNCCVVEVPMSLLLTLKKFAPNWLSVVRSTVANFTCNMTCRLSAGGDCSKFTTDFACTEATAAACLATSASVTTPVRTMASLLLDTSICSLGNVARSCFWISVRSGSTAISYGETLSPCQIMIVVWPGDLPLRTTSCGDTTTASAITGSETETREASSENW